MVEPLKCFVIGGDPTLTEYLQVLLDKNHTVSGVITRNRTVQDWAGRRKIPVLSMEEYQQVLRESPFDYLFAITHLEILPDEVLELPRKAAINIHGSPLPRYAGLNSPAWALMHREQQYGVTWHYMTPGVDKGDILKRRSFEVASNETSLSLNTKCFQAAVESFGELLDELVDGSAVATPQDLEQFTYFGRYARPPAACMLDWRRPAIELEALVRALDFGRNENLLGVPKLSRGDTTLAVTQCEIAEHGEVSKPPGTVLELGERSMIVATSQGALELTGLATLEGEPLSAPEAAERLGIKQGDPLDVLTDERAEQLSEINRALCRHEAHWVRRLSALEPVELPQAEDTASERRPQTETLALPTPEPFAARYGQNDRLVALLAAFGLYLGRITDREEFDFGFVNTALGRELTEVRSLVSDHVPAHCTVDFSRPFDDLIERTRTELATIHKRRTWMVDAMARFPELRSKRPVIDTTLRSIAFSESDRPPSLEPGELLQVVARPDGSRLSLVYDANRLSKDEVEAIGRQLSTLMESLGTAPERPVAEADLLDPSVRDQVLRQWNDTKTDYPVDARIHDLFEQQVDQTPDAIAVNFEGQRLTYRELDQRANQLAHHLVDRGVQPDGLVGVYLDRSIDLLVATLGILKAGGAYLPLDPSYPRERIAFLIEDTKVPIIITESHLRRSLPSHEAQVIEVDTDWPSIARSSSERVDTPASASDLAYIIYTSGSTGKPKGVMIEHRNVLNFFAGMDQRIPHDPPGTWLAVTSLSFDISVLELFWPLGHGFEVVLYRDHDRTAKPSSGSRAAMDFSLFYFAAGESKDQEKYRLLLEGAKFADDNGFGAVWTPERHFHAFGGLYPNPAVTGAAVAAVTKNVQIRAGSVVVPLNHPVRIAEAWSVVDNLSGGRVAISVASGWQPNDFVLRPQSYKSAKEVMFRDLETVKKLWRGETIQMDGPMGEPVDVQTYPRPVQSELPVWVTTAGNIETYRRAGAIGANILTHLLGQSVDDLKEKIEAYREARKENGHDPKRGIISLMVHTFVGKSDEQVKDIVREPLKQYLATSLGLLKKHAHTFFAAFTRKEAAKTDGQILAGLSDEEREAMLEHAFERYFESSGLFGTPDRAEAMVERLHAAGVDEVACLIDFGVDTDTVLENLEHLAELRSRFEQSDTEAPEPETDRGGISLPAQIHEYGVTHLQCTPSMARMLTMMEGGPEAIESLQHLMIGGEAFPIPLAHELDEHVDGATITNMYGPTETTIWSSTHPVQGRPDTIPIGRPIANTQLYVLDSRGQPMPPGIPGELYIGGDGVARGYLDREELTAERFVPDPFRGDGARMYRTGDVVRWGKDGVLEFLGRVDHQIKVHGHRIEPGEIEAALAKNAAVRQSVVVANESSPGDQRLVAYVVPEGPSAPSASTLRRALAESLPDYMVPSHFVVLDSLPLTPNGKIDRKALPAPEAQPTRSEAEYAAPENDLDRTVVEVWQETLGLDQVGIDDNFFDIGGHSLLVVSMHRRLRQRLEQPVMLTDLYRFPTIRSLTTYLAGNHDSSALDESAQRAEKRRSAMQRRVRRRA